MEPGDHRSSPVVARSPGYAPVPAAGKARITGMRREFIDIFSKDIHDSDAKQTKVVQQKYRLSQYKDKY